MIFRCLHQDQHPSSLRGGRCTKASNIVWDDRFCPPKPHGGTGTRSEGKRNKTLFRHEEAPKSSAVPAASPQCVIGAGWMSQALPRARLRRRAGAGPADGGWGCLSLRNIGQARSVSQPGQPPVPHSQPRPRPRPLQSRLCSRAQPRVPRRLPALHPALGYRRMRSRQNSWRSLLMLL